MKPPSVGIAIIAVFIFMFVSGISSLSVDADYITIFPGEEGEIKIDVENNQNFDIEDVEVYLNLENLPFSSIGSTSKSLDDLDEDDDDSVTFSLKATTDISPGDYNIPYTITYTNSFTEEGGSFEGSFGLRVSSKTELDYTVETNDGALVGEEGRVSLEIINRGLGEIKSVSVQLYPDGYTLISKDKIFIGTIDSDDSDLASFDVFFDKKNMVLEAEIIFKDFDNNEETKKVFLPFSVITKEEAIEKGLIQKNNSFLYLMIVAIVIILFFIYRKMKKRKKRKNS